MASSAWHYQSAVRRSFAVPSAQDLLLLKKIVMQMRPHLEVWMSNELGKLPNWLTRLTGSDYISKGASCRCIGSTRQCTKVHTLDVGASKGADDLLIYKEQNQV